MTAKPEIKKIEITAANFAEVEAACEKLENEHNGFRCISEQRISETTVIITLRNY